MTAALPEEDFHLDELLRGVVAWVEVESPTTHPQGVNRMMDLAEAELRELGATIERRPGRDGFGDVLSAQLPGRAAGPGVLVLAHLDTVHPVGTIRDRLEVRRDGGRLYGPGAFDMKGGAYCAVYALRRVLERDGRPPLPVSFLFIPDEEFGSPTTRELIEATARRHRYVLVPEPAQEAGNLITGRWAFQRFKLRARGRPAHAGATLAHGRSAIHEMAEQVLRIEALSQPERNVTLSVGVIHAGEFVNVVPSECSAEVLAVTPTQASFDDLRTRLLGLEQVGGDVTLTVEAGPSRPLFEPTDDGLALYRHARGLARAIGFDLGHGTVGGGSDGNFTGALGVPTLDGLGVCGGGFHTQEEFIKISSLVPRARLLAGLLRTLGRGNDERWRGC